MNRTEFITKYHQVVKMLGSTASRVVVASGGALLMLGLREHTNDLDLDVSENVFMKFRKPDNVEVFDGQEIVNVDETVALHVMKRGTGIMEIDGVYLYSVKELIRFKKRLIANPQRKKEKLEQDRADLVALENMLKAEPTSFRW